MAVQARELLAGAAYTIGIMLCVQRNREGITQGDLARELGIKQTDLSGLENGQPSKVSPAKIDALFRRLKVGDYDSHSDFIKWWASNADAL